MLRVSVGKPNGEAEFGIAKTVDGRIILKEISNREYFGCRQSSFGSEQNPAAGSYEHHNKTWGLLTSGKILDS
jgi:hypothetical protein